jgi:predicted component of type VI protein secretion system
MSDTNNTTRLELKVQSLKERFAKKIADYEDEIADIRAEATIMFEQLSQRLEEQQKELNDKNVQDVSSEG